MKWRRLVSWLLVLGLMIPTLPMASRAEETPYRVSVTGRETPARVTDSRPLSPIQGLSFRWDREIPDDLYIMSFYRQSLEGGYVRYTLEGWAPKGTQVLVVEPKTNSWRIDLGTATGLWQQWQFELGSGSFSQGQTMVAAFLNGSALYCLDTVLPYQEQTTSGKPLGDPVALEWTGETQAVHGVSLQGLDNGYARFSVTYSCQEPTVIRASDTHYGSILVEHAQEEPVEEGTLYFDYYLDALQELEGLTLTFGEGDGVRVSMENAVNRLETAMATALETPNQGSPASERTLTFTTGGALTDAAFQVHQITSRRLENGATRVTLYYEATDGMEIRAFDNPDGKRVDLDLGKTPSDPIPLEVDLKPEQAESPFWLVFRFRDLTHKEQLFVSALVDGASDLTSGEPVGQPRTLDTTTSGHLTGGTATVHSLTAQTLSNCHTRFTLAYTAPKGYDLCVYDGDKGETYSLMPGTTTGGEGILTFDLDQTLLEQCPNGMTLLFTRGQWDRLYVKAAMDQVSQAGEELPIGSGERRSFTTEGTGVSVTEAIAQPMNSGFTRFTLACSDPGSLRAELQTDSEAIALTWVKGYLTFRVPTGTVPQIWFYATNGQEPVCKLLFDEI